MVHGCRLKRQAEDCQLLTNIQQVGHLKLIKWEEHPTPRVLGSMPLGGHNRRPSAEHSYPIRS